MDVVTECHLLEDDMLKVTIITASDIIYRFERLRIMDHHSRKK